MSHQNYLFTSESVSEGHPDKVCDQISDAILDAFIENDVKLGIADDSLVNTRLGCETLCTTNKIVIAGEGRGQAPLFTKYARNTVVNREMISQIARNVLRDIGYDQDGFSYHGADIEVLLHGQSPDIAMGVDHAQPVVEGHAVISSLVPTEPVPTGLAPTDTWTVPGAQPGAPPCMAV